MQTVEAIEETRVGDFGVDAGDFGIDAGDFGIDARNFDARAEVVKTHADGFVTGAERGEFGAANEKPEVFVAGGAEIYRLLLPFTDRCFVTKVDTVAGADAFFPNLDSDTDFNMIEESEAITESGLRYRFTEYVRKTREE
ncbi:MAG: dihydrofolate reductase [Clostridiales Family XIII bacterium]|nr:dihydrofolate reductase [Clostridiales Family XIII bacterium]